MQSVMGNSTGGITFEAVVNQRLVVIRLTAGTDSGTLSLPDPLVQLLRSDSYHEVPTGRAILESVSF